VETLPHTRTGNIIANQLGRSGTSVGANYRAACRARSRADFVSKLGVVEEEADESAYWLELISEEEIVPPHKMQALLGEASELTAIMVSSRKTIGTGRPRSKIGN
jgi:four helix bundle protein